MEKRRVAVYGAAGHTGRFVARELERRELEPICIGRTPPAGADGRWRKASCDDPDELDRALAGAQAVINCAGPFSDTAPAVVEAALRCGIHYFDVAAEQRAARQTLATYDEDARLSKVVVMPAVAFYGGLADLLASLLAVGACDIESIDIGVALDHWHPTAGTRRTGERNTARRLLVEHGRLEPMPAGPFQGHWRFPEPFGRQAIACVPLSEIITIFRHIPVRSVRSFMGVAPLRELGDPRTPPPVAADASGRSSQQFVMDVVASSGRGIDRIAASGRDIYAVTAPLVVEACRRVLGGPSIAGGAFVAGQLFDAADFLAAVAPDIQVHRPPPVRPMEGNFTEPR